MAGSNKQQLNTKRKTIIASPMIVLMLMEDYEAMNGELINNPHYKQLKRKLTHGRKATRSE